MFVASFGMVGGKDLVVDEILLSHEKSHIINPPNVDWKEFECQNERNLNCILEGLSWP